jgi:hypothetical protein
VKEIQSIGASLNYTRSIGKQRRQLNINEVGQVTMDIGSFPSRQLSEVIWLDGAFTSFRAAIIGTPAKVQLDLSFLVHDFGAMSQAQA